MAGEVQFSPSILIKNIDQFSDGDHRAVKNYFRAVENAATIGNWNDEQTFQIGVMRIKGAALEAYNTSIGVQDWEGLKNLLLARFGSSEPRPILRQKLNDSRQRVGEDPIQFSQRLKTLVSEIHPNLQEASEEAQAAVSENLTDKFLDGLRPSLRRTVMSKQPQSWAEALEVAQLEHQLEEMNGKTRMAHIDAMPVDVSAPWHGEENPGEGSRSTYRRSQPLMCWHCGQPGYVVYTSPWCGSADLPLPEKITREDQYQQNRCSLCGGAKFHAGPCPAAVAVTEDDLYNPPQ